MTWKKISISDLAGGKTMVFDAGPLISMATNNLLSTLEKLKEYYAGRFILPESVKNELVNDPLNTKKFMFEAMQVERLISLGVFEVLADSATKELTLELLRLANSSFAAKGKQIQIVHYGEMAAIATAKLLDSEAVVMDERITRELVEHPAHLSEMMGKRLHTAINVSSQSLSLLKKYSESIKIIRSAELAMMAFELGLLDRYLAPGEEKEIHGVKKKLIESVLWGLKMNGCAISSTEIEELTALKS